MSCGDLTAILGAGGIGWGRVRLERGGRIGMGDVNVVLTCQMEYGA